MAIFGVVKSCKMLDFVGFVEVCIEVVALSWIEVKCLGNADFTRGLWIEQMYLVCNRTFVLKM